MHPWLRLCLRVNLQEHWTNDHPERRRGCEWWRWLKRSSVFEVKEWWHHQLPHRVTPNLVTPLEFRQVNIELHRGRTRRKARAYLGRQQAWTEGEISEANTSNTMMTTFDRAAKNELRHILNSTFTAGFHQQLLDPPACNGVLNSCCSFCTWSIKSLPSAPPDKTTCPAIHTTPVMGKSQSRLGFKSRLEPFGD